MTTTCTHERTLRLSAKCSDLCFAVFPDGTEKDGYAPDIEGLGGGDYVEVTVCIDCKQVVGLTDADAILAMQDQIRSEQEEREQRKQDLNPWKGGVVWDK